MTDSVSVLPPGFRYTDNDGALLSGGKLKFFDSGTTNAKTVYSNEALSASLGTIVYSRSDGLPVASSGSSTVVGIYTGTADYKCILTDSSDTTIWTLDNIRGQIDTSTFLTTGSTSTLDIAVSSKTANHTLVAADNGKLINADPSGGNFTLTFTAAATLGDGWNVEIRNAGTSGQVLLASSQAIAFPGGGFTAYAMEIGEALLIRCNGTAFQVASRTAPLMGARAPGIITITDRVTADPGAPTPGARYIVTTGYGSYATHDIIEANGSSFNKFTPVADCGWLAYVQDEDAMYQFVGSAWAQIVPIPASSDTLAGRIEIAVQSEMETPSSTTLAVVPGRQHYHPGHLKAWAFVLNGTTALTADYGCASIADGGTGDFTITFDTAFSATAAYTTAGGTARGTGGGSDDAALFIQSAHTKTVSTFQAKSLEISGFSAIDSVECGISFVGDQ